MAESSSYPSGEISQSPVITVVAIEDGLDEPKSFYIHQSLLRNKSRYFSKALDSCQNATPESHVITTTFADWQFQYFVNWLYYGESRDSSNVVCWEFCGLWGLATELEAPLFQNAIVDWCQGLKFDKCFIHMFYDFDDGNHDRTKLATYIRNKVGYEIVAHGWTRFIETAESLWEDITRTSFLHPGLPLLLRLMAEVDIATELLKTVKLSDPAETKDCSFHTHTDEDKKQCPRYKSSE
ncbi:hypothetical protein A1O3_04379 [Capronia epimyces CBS 606.96]|uniref:BTB domain-containing protein n=1 Tax=Capronia epimyces CBS 606.96 TaxID=1182542 RepID=W9YYQ8_9EURO|nr:uncharacterized protein A1O3_04379 [Capronia epimyces CBS 606.96]EXJ87419.1 hypothetical protein A1O3_04379 [Capronia epimyces CBS 606.96]